MTISSSSSEKAGAPGPAVSGVSYRHQGHGHIRACVTALIVRRFKAEYVPPASRIHIPVPRSDLDQGWAITSVYVEHSVVFMQGRSVAAPVRGFLMGM